MLQSCLCCCTARRPGRSLEPSSPGLTALTAGLSDRFLAFNGATSFPMKQCGPLPDSRRPPLWLPPARSAGMDMCFACHRTILLGLSWTFDPGSLGWKRPRGASRTRWFDVVKREFDQLGLDPAAIEPLAQDRDKWRALLNLVGSTRRRTPCARHDDDYDISTLGGGRVGLIRHWPWVYLSFFHRRLGLSFQHASFKLFRYFCVSFSRLV